MSKIITDQRPVILIRTHFFDARIEEIAARLSRDDTYRVAILADHRSWTFPTGEYRCVSLTWARLRALELPLDVGRDVLWLCGDYGLYVAREEFPNAPHFWLYEYDVHIHAADLIEALVEFDAKSDADLLVTNLRTVDSRMTWSRAMSRVYTDLYSCSYPFVRLSSEAIATMRRARTMLGLELKAGKLDWLRADGYPIWPNDEALTATSVKAAGLSCRDVNELRPGFYDEATFHVTDVIINREQLDALPADGRLYHSVRWGKAYLTAVAAKAGSLPIESLRNIRGTVHDLSGSQWTPDQAAAALSVIGDEIASRVRQTIINNRLRASNIIGSFDWFDAGKEFHGWVVDRENPEYRGIVVDLHLDGQIIASATASVPRDDGFHGFKIRTQKAIEPITVLNGRMKLLALAENGSTFRVPMHPPTRSKIESIAFQHVIDVVKSPEAVNAILADLIVNESQTGMRFGLSKDPPKSPRTASELSALNIQVGTTTIDDSGIVGRNGHLFIYRGSNNLYWLHSLDSENEYVVLHSQSWVELIARRSAFMKQRGAKFIQLIIPDKSSVYPDFFPLPIHAPTTLLRRIESEIECTGYLSAIEILRAAAQSGRCFLRTGSHLSEFGAMKVIFGILDEIEVFIPKGFESAHRRFGETDGRDRGGGDRIVVGDLAHRFLGVRLYETCPRTSAAAGLARGSNAVEMTEAELPDGSHYPIRMAWTNDEAPIKIKVVAFGNSFFERGAEASGLSWWCKHLFQEFHFVWSDHLSEDYVRSIDPDLVICQTVERFLTIVPADL